MNLDGLFTSESVSEGHPDKMADQISDAVLDEMLKQDYSSRVACETLVTTGLCMIAGEITSKAVVSIPDIAREVIKDIGYVDSSMGFDYKTCSVLVALDKQSPDISQGVTEGTGRFKEQGAGDQGMMFGYASNETEELMPLPIILSHKLVKKLADLRKSGEIGFLWPDSKSQVSVWYENDKPKSIETVVISTQHSPEILDSTGSCITEDAQNLIIEKVIKPVCENWLTEDTKYFINPTGKFVVGGPHGDCGLTGRKIIVDTYGGMGRHGGGAFSGKDPSKVDRSAAYMARYIAKNIVAAELAEKCEVQLAYAIGVAEPVSVLVYTFGTNKIEEKRIVELVRKNFELKPRGILESLKLLDNPKFRNTAAYGHFGRSEFSWEKLDKVAELKKG